MVVGLVAMSDVIGSGPARGFVVRPGEGARLDLPDWQMAIKVGAEDTAGALTVIEGILAPGHPGPAPHIHDGHDECFVLLEGRMRFRVDAGFHTATAGDTVFAGRGLAHGFANPFAESAGYLVMLTPSGYEAYFAELVTQIAETGRVPDFEWTTALMAKYSTRPVSAVPDSNVAD